MQILSVLGAVHAGRHSEGAVSALEVARSWGSGDEAVALLTGERLPHHNAIFANACASVSFDFDDYVFAGHTGHSAVCASFAYGELDRASGKDVLAAVTVANEVGGRLGASLLFGPQNGQMWSYIHIARRCVRRCSFARTRRVANGARDRHRVHAAAVSADACVHGARLEAPHPGFDDRRRLPRGRARRARMDGQHVDHRGPTGVPSSVQREQPRMDLVRVRRRVAIRHAHVQGRSGLCLHRHGGRLVPGDRAAIRRRRRTSDHARRRRIHRRAVRTVHLGDGRVLAHVPVAGAARTHHDQLLGRAVDRAHPHGRTSRSGVPRAQVPRCQPRGDRGRGLEGEYGSRQRDGRARGVGVLVEGLRARGRPVQEDARRSVLRGLRDGIPGGGQRADDRREDLRRVTGRPARRRRTPVGRDAVARPRQVPRELRRDAEAGRRSPRARSRTSRTSTTSARSHRSSPSADPGVWYAEDQVLPLFPTSEPPSAPTRLPPSAPTRLAPSGPTRLAPSGPTRLPPSAPRRFPAPAATMFWIVRFPAPAATMDAANCAKVMFPAPAATRK